MEDTTGPLPAQEQGSTTITFATMVAALVLISSFFIGAGVVRSSQAQLQAVADLAALAAADATPVSAAATGSPVSGCPIAGEIAAANGVSLSDCHSAGLDVYVVLQKQQSTLVLPVTLRAKARAGPLAP